MLEVKEPLAPAVRSTSGSNVRPIPRIESETPRFFERSLPDAPLVVRGIVKHWPALKVWTPDHFRTKYGQIVFKVSVNLPAGGVPAEHRWDDHIAEMRLGDFVDLMHRPGQRCYVHQLYAHRIPGLDGDFDFRDLTGPADSNSAFVWIGSGDTRSSFHFDLAANIFVQVYGRKRVLLASPGETGRVYPYRYNIAKSRLDPESADLARFPKFAQATLWQTLLEPGDVLYFPRTWWHDFRSLEPSISLNHFTGEKASLGELARVATAGGAGHWARLAKDFVWHGLFGRKFERRLFSEEPTGLFFYQLFKDGLRQRLLGRR